MNSGLNSSSAGRMVAAHGVAEFGRARGRPQRHVDDVADAALARRAGAGIKRRLMGRGEEHGGIVLEHGLGPVAVVDVEIDDGDACELVMLARARGADGHVVEQAEAHRMLRLGVMARRTHGAEGVAGGSLHHGVDRRRHRAGRAQRRLARARRQDGVGIDRGIILLRHGGDERVDEGPRMDARDVGEIGRGRLAMSELGEGRAGQAVEHRLEPRRGFRVMAAGVVRETGLVGHQQRGHAGKCRTSARAPPMGRTGLAARRAAQ